MKKKLLISVFLYFLISNSWASDSYTADSSKKNIIFKYNTLGISVGQDKVTFLSPITYSSYSFKYSWNTNNIKNNKLILSNYDLTLGLNTNVNYNAMLLLRNDYVYSHNYKLSKVSEANESFQLFLGWAYWYDDDYYINIQNINNAIYLNGNNKASFSFFLSKKIGKVSLINEGIVPIVGLYWGSKYSQIAPGFFEETKFKDGFKIGSFETNTQFRNRLNCDVQIKTKKYGLLTLRTQYEVDYSILRLHNNIRHSISHTIKLGFLFNKQQKSYYVHQ